MLLGGEGEGVKFEGVTSLTFVLLIFSYFVVVVAVMIDSPFLVVVVVVV